MEQFMGVVTSESLMAHLADENVPMFKEPVVVPPPEPIPAAAAEAAAQPAAEPAEAEEPAQDEAPASGESAEQYTARVQKRINKLVRERKEEEEFAQSQFNRARAAEREADELRAKLAESVSPTTAQAAEDKKPDAKTYTDPALTQEERSAKYEEDLLAWNRRETIRQYRDEQARAQAQAEAVAKDEAFKKQVSDFEKESPGFGERLESSGLLVPIAAAAAITESPVGAYIADYLIKNPAEAERLIPMSPARAAAEIGKLEERLSKPAEKPAAPPPVKSRAPTPIEPITAPSTSVTADPSKMDVMQLREYHRSRAGEQRVRRRN